MEFGRYFIIFIEIHFSNPSKFKYLGQTLLADHIVSLTSRWSDQYSTLGNLIILFGLTI